LGTFPLPIKVQPALVSADSSAFNATRNDKQIRLVFRMALSDDGGEPQVELALV
jgi:hypothetical protein